MIRPPSPLRVASWTPVATLPASNSQRAVNINGKSRPYFVLHSPKVCNFKLPKVSSSKLTLTDLPETLKRNCPDLPASVPTPEPHWRYGSQDARSRPGSPARAGLASIAPRPPSASL